MDSQLSFHSDFTLLIDRPYQQQKFFVTNEFVVHWVEEEEHRAQLRFLVRLI